jgi:hypothetical protein
LARDQRHDLAREFVVDTRTTGGGPTAAPSKLPRPAIRSSSAMSRSMSRPSRLPRRSRTDGDFHLQRVVAGEDGEAFALRAVDDVELGVPGGDAGRLVAGEDVEAEGVAESAGDLDAFAAAAAELRADAADAVGVGDGARELGVPAAGRDLLDGVVLVDVDPDPRRELLVVVALDGERDELAERWRASAGRLALDGLAVDALGDLLAVEVDVRVDDELAAGGVGTV